MARKEDSGYDEGIADDEQGELLAFMKDIERESKSMMEDLMFLDDKLASIQSRLEMGKVDRKELIKDIESVRVQIGVIEKEDLREINEEEIARSLLSKLKRWVDQVV